MTARTAPCKLLRRLTGCVLPAMLLLNAAACTPPHPAMPVGGTLQVMGPGPAFTSAINKGTLPQGWEFSGTIAAGNLSIRQVERFTALNVMAGTQPFQLVRRINASLLATPYLNWAWHTQPPRAGAHPVRLLVELTDRNPQSKRSLWPFSGSGRADASRIILLGWDATALGRGTIVGPIRADDYPETARYIARGGPEQADRWWVDSVDLSLIHRQVWPGDDPANFDISAIGISVQAAGTGAAMNLAEIRLTR
ncbi:MAG: hypothetical protein WD075_01450 [Rhodospirillales bacterium]